MKFRNPTEYQVRVYTDEYAGNFGRELCAWMTGSVGQCNVGHAALHLVQQTGAAIARMELPANPIPTRHVSHEGNYKPMALGHSTMNIVIYFEAEPSAEDMSILWERAQSFNKSPTRVGKTPVKIDKIELEVVTITTEIKSIRFRCL